MGGEGKERSFLNSETHHLGLIWESPGPGPFLFHAPFDTLVGLQ